MYYVSGMAEPPKANGKITRDVSCKTNFTETLSVHNWLKKAQRCVPHFTEFKHVYLSFFVTYEIISPDQPEGF